MRKTIVASIAHMIYFAANTGAGAGAVNLSTEQPEGAQPPVTKVPEGQKGTVGKDDPELLAEAARQTGLISELLEMKKAIVVPKDHESAEYKALIADMSTRALQVGDATKEGRVSSAKLWPLFEAMAPMTVKEKDGKLDLGKFCKAIWNLFSPDVKLLDPFHPGEFYAWDKARQRGNSAAMAIENVRNYVRNNGPALYPEFFPKVEKAGEVSKEVKEQLAAYEKADKAVSAVLSLTYLPKTSFVELDAEGLPKEGAKAVTLADILKALKAEIDSHIPGKEGAKEKAEAASAEQIARELEEQRKELEQLKLEKAELEKEKAELEKARLKAGMEAKLAEPSPVKVNPKK